MLTTDGIREHAGVAKVGSAALVHEIADRPISQSVEVEVR